ncbi:MAG: uridine kinase [Bacteroidetes bacterium]|nr:MAG: uridine kinase [Bacteroidota bacterium]
MPQSYIVGLCGGSGSGKSFFLHQLCAQFEPNQICLVTLDNYYKPREHQEKDDQGVLNFDLPQGVHLEKCIADIQALQAGKVVELEEYTFNNPSKKASVIVLKPAPIILVEGLFIFQEPTLRKLLDLKVYIDAEDHIRIKRRILRDNKERGYDMGDVLYRYEYHVYPSYQKYIAPYKREADIVINNHTNFTVGLDVLTGFLKSKI